MKFGFDNHRIFKGIALVSCFLIFGKLVAALKEIVLAYRYGMGEQLDVYMFALVLAQWLPIVVVNLLQSVLVPQISKLPVSERSAFHAQLATLVLAAGFVFWVLATWLIFPNIQYIAPDLSTDLQVQIVRVGLAIAPISVFMGLNALYSAELLARERHANTLLEVVPSFVLLVTVLLWPGDEPLVEPLIFGTVIGLAAQTLSLWIAVSYANIKTGFSLTLSYDSLSGFIKAISVLITGGLAMSLINPIDNILASRLGEGSISSLSYAKRLLTLGLGLAITVISRAMLPVFSNSTKSLVHRKQFALTWSNWLVLLGIVGALVAWTFVPWAVSLMFERGAFTADDTILVSDIIRAGLIQLPFLFAGMVLVQLLHSMQLFKLISYSSFIALAVKVLTGFWLADQYGTVGIMYSTSLMFFATFLYFVICVRRLQLNTVPQI